MKRTLLALAVSVALVATACGRSEEAGPLRIVTHDSFAISDDVLESFSAETGIQIEILRGGDAGAVVSQAILVKGNPTADVLFGIDNTFLSRALDEGLFRPYESQLIDTVDKTLRTVSKNHVTPIDFGDVCLNYDKARLSELGLDVPTSLRQLTLEEYRGTLVVENPSTSSPGLAFLFATIATFGEDGDYTWQDFWTELAANDVEVVPGWEEAYYGAFAGGGDGDLPLVVSYATSPPAGVFFSDPAPDVAPTGNIDAGCFRQIEYAGILDGTDKPDAAAQFIDFMLSVRFQEDIPLNMFVFPANRNAALPDVFVKHVVVPQNSVALEPATIEANRNRWISEWTDIFR